MKKFLENKANKALLSFFIALLSYFVSINYHIDLILIIIGNGTLIYAFVLALYVLYDELFDKKKPLKIDIEKILNFVSLSALILSFIILTFGTSIMAKSGNENTKPIVGRTYVTYNLDCNKCEISYDNLKRAVALYNIKHCDEKIQMVNLKNDTPLSNTLNKDLEKYGSIVKYTGTNLNQEKYTLTDEKGEAIENSTSTIYSQLKKMAKS